VEKDFEGKIREAMKKDGAKPSEDEGKDDEPASEDTKA
jgi:hypothetical protein